MAEEIKYGVPPGERKMYDGDDKEAKKIGLTQLQYDWLQSYLATGNATQAIRAARGGEIKPADNVTGFYMKNNTRIMQYIQSTADECAKIQFEEIIKNPKAPFAVRSDAIKDRLNRAGVGVQKEEERGNLFVGDIQITIEK